MKRTLLVSMLLLLALLLCACQNAPAPTSTPGAVETAAPSSAPVPVVTPSPEPSPTEKPVSEEVQAMLDENKAVWREMHNRPYMEGRLLIPSAGIDVALFSEGDNPQNKSTEVLRQDVVDLEDSALLYYDDPVGNIIADHSNQDFSALPNVKIGDAAYILSGDRMVTLECVFATDGVNTGYGITDMDGGWHHDDADYVCYTCLEDWTHIQMVGFAMKDEDFFDMDWIDVGETDSASGTTASSSSSNNGVATTISMPAPGGTEANGASGASGTSDAAPAQSAAPAPSATPEPAPAAPAAPRPAAQEPVDYDVIPGYDIYADADSTFGIYYSNGIDTYLG